MNERMNESNQSINESNESINQSSGSKQQIVLVEYSTTVLVATVGMVLPT
jgi:hypothetical protein